MSIDKNDGIEYIRAAVSKRLILDTIAIAVTYISLWVVSDLVGLSILISLPRIITILVLVWLLICCLVSLALTMAVISGIMLYARTKLKINE